MINRGLLMVFIILVAISAMILLSVDAFAIEEAGKGRKIWDSIMLLVNFGILVFFFIKFARKPLMKFLYGEREKIENSLNSVDEKIKKARELMDVEADKLKNIDEHMEKIRNEIIELGQKERSRIIEKAKNNANMMIEDAQKEAQYKFELAKKRFSEEMLDIAVSIATKELKKGISQEDNEKIVDQFSIGLNRAERNGY
ncbi:hypothetical protein ACFL7M_08560 [Thermodesulfobacteriota bacterium]